MLEEVCKQCGTQLDGFTEGDADTAKQAQATVAAAQYLPKKNNANQLFNAELGEAANAARGGRTKRAVLAEWYGEAQAGRGPHLRVLREAQEQAARNRAAFYIARDSRACAPVDSDSSDSDDDEIVFPLLYTMEMREMRDAQDMQDTREMQRAQEAQEMQAEHEALDMLVAQGDVVETVAHEACDAELYNLNAQVDDND